jgi:hypothetical protein
MKPTHPDFHVNSYLAGLFDGEGTISATVTPDGNVRFRITLGLADPNETPAPVVLLQQTFGGKVTKIPYHTASKGENVMHIWACDAVERTRFLEAVGPFLILKRTQGEQALRLSASFDTTRGAAGRGTALHWSVKEERAEYARIIQAANLRAKNRGHSKAHAEAVAAAKKARGEPEERGKVEVFRRYTLGGIVEIPIPEKGEKSANEKVEESC